jgi:2-polyprenyl-6-methoxyphenol hydroxylase-like FAD-dependent oxidoreductase
MDTQVLIVGAGPTGLVLALWLARQNVAFRIIDKGEGPGATSRALIVHARTLEYYRQLGLAEQIVAAGIQLDHLDLRVSGRKVGTAPLGAFGEEASRYPFLLGLPQDEHERLLIAELTRLGVLIERRTSLMSLTQDEAGVTAILHGPKGEERVKAAYLAGCDGASSIVRHQIGAGFPGGTYAQVFFVADVDADGGGPDQALTVSLNREGFCLVLPVRRTGTLRVIGMVPAAREHQESFAYADVGSEVARDTRLAVTKVHWFSTYHVHHRVADRFRAGCVFLAGDAGHIHSPAGGQGMNTGIGDAVNLGWKLAAVLKGVAGLELLDTYAEERMAFARTLVATTDRAFRAVATRSWFGAFWRTWVMPSLTAVLFRLKPFLRLAFRAVSQTAIEYRGSRLSQGYAGQVKAGDRLPWIRSIGNYVPLDDLGWHIQVYGDTSDALRASVGSLPIHTFGWTDDIGAHGFARDALYLIRPDGHIGFATLGQGEAAMGALRAYCASWGLDFPDDPTRRR